MNTDQAFVGPLVPVGRDQAPHCSGRAGLEDGGRNGRSARSDRLFWLRVPLARLSRACQT